MNPEENSLISGDSESKAVVAQFQEQMEKAIEQCKTEEERMAQYVEANKQLMETIREKTAEKNSLFLQTKSIEEEIAKVHEEAREVQLMKEAVKAQLEETNAKLAEVDKEIEDENKEYNSMRDEIIKANLKTIDELYHTIDSYTPDKQQIEMQLHTEKLKALESEVAAAEREIALRKGQRASIEAQKSAEDAESTTGEPKPITAADIEALRAERDRLRQELETNRAKRRAERDAILEEQNRERQYIAELQAEGETLQREYEDVHFNVVSLRSTLATSFCSKCSGPLLESNM